MFFYKESEENQDGGAIQGSVDADPYFDKVSLLLPLDADLNDVSTNGHTVTAYGNAAVSTAHSKFGGGSVYFDGNGDYLKYSSSTATNLTNRAWTIECWFKAPSVNGIKAVFQTEQGGGSWQPYYAFEVTTGNVINVNRNFQRVSVGTYTPNEWHHVAMARTATDGVLTTYFNGSAVDAVSSNAPGINFNFVLGLLSNWGGYYGYLSGYVDDFRVTKGVARYTANFTPPTEAHPTS